MLLILRLSLIMSRYGGPSPSLIVSPDSSIDASAWSHFPVRGRGFEVIAIGGEQGRTGSTQVRAGYFAVVYQLSGTLDCRLGTQRQQVASSQVLRAPEGTTLNWNRQADTQALVVLLSTEFLCSELEPYRPGLHPGLRGALFEERGELELNDFSDFDRAWLESIRSSPVQGEAMTFWYRSKIQEVLALQAFPAGKPEEEFFCSRQRRLASERVTKVKWLLGQQIDEPLDLKALAKQVGCSSHYLCRTFSAETGITISRYLRSLRIDRAAALLRSGRFNVSEAAIEVGYQSLSHFSKAFQQEKGCPPSQYVPAA